ncbi:MAG TPA: endonuclease/exonuclease/phosphatase family protein [bacterium]|nr:endonuclease/exonuclease/phosphatase family protein [bacterium]
MEGKQVMKKMTIYVVLGVLSGFIAGCGDKGTNSSAPDDEPARKTREVSFLTYNVWMVPGIEGGGSGKTAEEEMERLELVVDLLKRHDADVFGIQEAGNDGVAWWPEMLVDSSMTVVEYVEQELGVQHAIGEFMLHIFSKFDILDGEIIYFPPEVGGKILRVTLRDDYGEPWIVYNTHLKTGEDRTGQYNWIRENLPASSDTLTVFMGDTNTAHDYVGENMLPGWVCVAYNRYVDDRRVAEQYGLTIDQIWLSGDMNKVSHYYWLDRYNAWGSDMVAASDHHPVMGRIVLWDD